VTRVPWIGSETLASFKFRGYSWLWLSISLNGYANMMSQIAIGWLALELTGSPLGVGIAVASRALPRIFLGVPFGALSDRHDRRVILQLTNFFGAAVSVGAVVTVFFDSLSFGMLVGVAVLVGVFDVAETSVSRALVYDLVGSKQALNGMALVSLADKLFAVLGALSAGLLLSLVGEGGAFAGMGVAYFLSALSLAGVRRAYIWKENAKDVSPSEKRISIPKKRPPGKFTKNLVMIWKNPGLLLLAGIAVTMEVLAFSSDVLLPSFARDIFKVGESGLGIMTAVRNVGGVVGVLVLAGISTRVRQGPLLGFACVAFGLGLVAFAGSPAFVLALFVLFLIGMMWASVDSLLPALLQYSVRDEERGASVGVWNLSRGLGPLGHLEVGAIAGAIGTSLALTINGGFIVIIVALIVLYYRTKGFEWPSVSRISEDKSREEKP
jgi:MFS family permease